MVKLGSVVRGTVHRVTPHAIIVNVTANCCLKGSISTEHLADHQGTYFKS